MQQSNPYLLSKILKKLKILIIPKGEKTRLLSESISIYLQKIPELKRFINENNPENESKIFFEVAKYLKYAKYQKGQFIKHSYDLDNFFYMTFSGDIAKFDIKYNRLYLSFKEYLIHLIKLRLLGENYLYLKCIRKNQKVFPFDEKMDILTTEDIKIDHYPELIKKIKNEINNSTWLTNTNKNNSIEDFLQLYNPEIINIKSAFLGKETKYPTYLPFYIFDKMMDPVSFIGQLTKPKGIKFLSSYVCLNISDIFYIDKTKIDKNNNLFNLFQRRVSEDVIKKLFERHFFFQDTDKSFLIKNYSRYFYVQRFVKGEKLIQQNTPNEGIYFINSGIFQLKTLRTYNELNDLLFSILHALDNFPKAFLDYQSKINDLEQFNKNKYKNIFEGLSQSQISKFTETKNIAFNTFISPDVVGLNDTYDNKTGLNNFSVECISDEAEVYFLPSEIVTSMLTEDNINTKISEFIGKQCMLLISEINKYKESFENTVQLEISNYKETKYNRYHSLNLKKSLNLKNENKKINLINYKYKKNLSQGFGNFSNSNSNYSTTKSNNISNYNINNQSLNKIRKNTRYEKYPNIFSIMNNIKGNDLKIKLKTDPYNSGEYFKTSLNFYKPKKKKNLTIKNNILNSQKNYLDDRTSIKMKNNINNDGNKNEFYRVINKFKTNIVNNYNKTNGLFNKSFNKKMLKNFSKLKSSGKELLNYNNYGKDKNVMKRSINILKSAFNKKSKILFIKNMNN